MFVCGNLLKGEKQAQWNSILPLPGPVTGICPVLSGPMILLH